jgi:deazaflavin-dependent oxidoreductase (nitroreductase family)
MRPQTKRSAPFPRAFARFNRKVANPVMRPAAGWLPPFAVVMHRGRVTGRGYATPVLAFRTGNLLVVGVLYGTSSDWVRNLLTTSRTQIKRFGRVSQYEQPRLIGTDEGMRLLPPAARGAFRVLGVRDFLRLTASRADHPTG